MSGRSYDCVVVGAGIVGLATALSISRARPGTKIAVLEKEPEVASHQSSHNSGVIHSGIFYEPGSKRAELCVRGKTELIKFLQSHSIGYRNCGKLIIATRTEELPLLKALMKNGQGNGLTGLVLLNPAEAREIEPEIICAAALHVPETSVVDYKEVSLAYRKDLEAAGGTVLTGSKLRSGRRAGGRWELATSAGTLSAGLVVNCAGVYNDRVAQDLGVDPEGRTYPFRGEFHRLSPAAASRILGLVYTVQNPELPFLGVHLTPTVHGDVMVGPNALLATSREGYLRRDIDMKDLWESVSFPGFPHFIAHYARTGASEAIRSVWKSMMMRELKLFAPFVGPKDLSWGFSGVRAEFMSLDGKLETDFVIRRTEGAVHVLNAPSPAATSSLALGAEIAKIAVSTI